MKKINITYDDHVNVYKPTKLKNWSYEAYKRTGQSIFSKVLKKELYLSQCWFRKNNILHMYFREGRGTNRSIKSVAKVFAQYDCIGVVNAGDIIQMKFRKKEKA